MGLLRTGAMLAAIAVAWPVAGGHAQTYTGSFANPVTSKTDTASVTFSIVSGSTTYLDIMLTNTSAFSDYGNNDVLAGLFFEIASGTSTTLTPVSALTVPQSISHATIQNPSTCSASFVATCSAVGTAVDVGGEWAFQYSASGFVDGVSPTPLISTTARYGIGAAGFANLAPNNFGGAAALFGSSPPNLDGGGGPGGLGFGIVGNSYNSSISQNGFPFVQNSVNFRFSLPTGVTSLSISNITFAYGTNPDGSVGATLAPEPAGIAALVVALGGLAATRRARRRSLVAGRND